MSSNGVNGVKHQNLDVDVLVVGVGFGKCPRDIISSISRYESCSGAYLGELATDFKI
jgi:hypothetical protein